MVFKKQARIGHHVEVATETDSSLLPDSSLLISCSINLFFCISSCYSKDVATAAGRWYWRILSTSSMKNWPWNVLWDVGLNNNFQFPTLSVISPLMLIRTSRPLVLLVCLFSYNHIFLLFVPSVQSLLIFSPYFPQPIFLFRHCLFSSNCLLTFPS